MRINIFGIQISYTNQNDTFIFLSKYDYKRKAEYICLPDLSVLISAQKDIKLREILNNSLLTLPDGKSIEILCKLKGAKKLSTVSGYWLIKKLLTSELSHYFYGSDKHSIKVMVSNLKREFPNSNILGYNSPPYVSINEIEDNYSIKDDFETIKSLNPDMIWVGISSPKQDYMVHSFYKTLDRGIIIAVGGVFDYLSGSKKISPEWIKKTGFRWLYRLIQEPRRLCKKYVNAFLGLIILLWKTLLKRLISTLKSDR